MQARTVVLAFSTLGFVLGGVVYKRTRPAVSLVVEHAPLAFERRAGDLTANVCGRYRGDRPLCYRLNDGPWRSLDPRGASSPRVPDGRFSIELPRAELDVGRNVLEILGGTRRAVHAFAYRDAAVELPQAVDWAVADLDVQDGHWHRLAVEGETRVRPVPGTEGYDRILNATGAFTGARRVEVDVTFRRATEVGRMFGFGVLPLWGGHRDDEAGQRPRRGWRYGIAWYYSKQGGVGVETSDKLGAADYTAAVSYETFPLAEDTRYRVVVECRPDGAGWVLRTKWWPDGAPEPDHWIELAESGERLPADGEYAVALVAHRCQAEFGAVRVTRL